MSETPSSPRDQPLPTPEEIRLEGTGLRENISKSDTPIGGERCASPTIEGPEATPIPWLETESLVGQTLGDFEILAEVGRGGMGIVYKARQVSLERIVALKTLLAEHYRKPHVLARFQAEAKAAASLHHPNIVNVYQVGQWAGGHYFVMELIEGRSLQSVLRERTVPVPWAVSLMVPVAEALHHAHTKGVVHRDLKPANIMIDKFRRPVVMDFGLAKVAGKSSSLTQIGIIMGTPAYMSPEQAGEDASQVGPLSDIYSLGAILYTMLAGRPPFSGSTPLATVLKVVAIDPAPPIRSFRPDVPVKLEQLCLKCLSKNPAERLSSAQALADELRKFRATSSKKSSSISLNETLPSVVLVSQESGEQIRLFSATTVIGRASECDLILRAKEVSKRHCRIHLEADQAVVEDLGSANGTLVNGHMVQRTQLEDGDQLDIAGHLFQIRNNSPKSPSRTDDQWPVI
jgi:serine/threonine protein kinase